MSRKHFDISDYDSISAEEGHRLDRVYLNQSTKDERVYAFRNVMLSILFVGATMMCITYLPMANFTAISELSKSEVSTSSSATKKPNFVFILADDVSWNAIGTSTSTMAFATPHMTTMATSGVVLSNYYSQEVCTPARASLMTGRYPAALGMQFGEILPSEKLSVDIHEIFMPEVLQDNGYITYGLGKWNLGHYNPQVLPTARGFDHFLGYMDGHNYYWSKLDPSDNGYQDFMLLDADCYAKYDGADLHTYSTTIYKNKAISAIEGHDFDANPMFLYLAVTAAHDPFTDLTTRQEGLTDVDVGERRYTMATTAIEGMKRQQYAMSLMLLDDAVDEIHTALKTAGQMDNTYIIFASDNGGCYLSGGAAGPLRGSKGSLYEGGTKVDAFVYSPILLAKAAGSVYGGLMHVSDWFPTISAWAGVEFAPSVRPIDGYDQSAAISSAQIPSDTPVREFMLYGVYKDVEGKNFDIQSNAPFAMRNTQYKLMHAFVGNVLSEWYPGGDAVEGDDDISSYESCSQEYSLKGNYTRYLFDIVNDPYELVNLYDDEQYNDIKVQLYYKMETQYVKPELFSFYQDTAYSVFDDNGVYIQPFNFTVLAVELNKSYPQSCDSSKIHSAFSYKV